MRALGIGVIALGLTSVLMATGCVANGGGESEPTGARPPDTPSSTKRPEVNADQARALAKGLIAFEASAARGEWRGADVAALVPFYASDGDIQAWEAEVVDAEGAPAGWVMVEAWEAFGPIGAFSSEGPSNARALAERYAAELGADLSNAEHRFLWVGAGTAALEVSTGPAAGRIFAPAPEVSALYEGGATRELPSGEEGPDASARLAEQAELRDALQNHNFSSPLLNGERVQLEAMKGSFPRLTVGSGSSSFSGFQQEPRTWWSSSSTTYCYTGCTPVAFGIVLEYWDRNGYPGMIATTTDNSNTSYTDPDVRWTLNELRRRLNTSCALTNNIWMGSTSSAYYAKAVDHVNTRGVGSWSSDNTSDNSWISWWDKWERLKAQINGGSPVVLHFDSKQQSGSIDHSAAVYGYTDATGDAADTIDIKTGWQNPVSMTVFKAKIGNYHVTRLMHP